MLQDRGRNVIGQVGDNARGSGRGDQSAEIDIQRISFDHAKIGAPGETLVQIGNKFPVELDRDDARAALDQQSGQGSLPRPDLDDRFVRPRRDLIDYALRIMTADQIILTQAAFGSHLLFRLRITGKLPIIAPPHNLDPSQFERIIQFCNSRPADPREGGAPADDLGRDEEGDFVDEALFDK
jgi:hypothetical protein